MNIESMNIESMNIESMNIECINTGYIYCLSNPLYNGIYKVGMTENDPKVRKEQLNTTGVPLPFKIEFAKKVKDYKEKEKLLHKLLTQYGERINPRREFFKISLEEIKAFFDLMDGEIYQEVDNSIIIDDVIEISSSEDDEIKLESKSKLYRDMKKCFNNRQRIRHVIGITDIWIGVYDYESNKILYNGNQYNSLSSFSSSHYKESRPDRTNKSNGWLECECETENDKWISTNNLSIFSKIIFPS